MQPQATPILDAWNKAAADPATLTVDGYGVSISVNSAHLVISDGIAGERRIRRIPRVPRTISRILILAPAGQVTCEADRWMMDAGITWAHIDRDGRILSASGPQREDPRLLRALAFAAENGPLENAGLEIMRSLISAKLDGQAQNLSDVFRAGNETNRLRDLAGWVRKAETLPDVRTLEAQGAAVYWQVWAGRAHVPFPPSDLAKVPAHWRTYAGRTSLTSDYPINRNATDPINGLLNFAYWIGETECVHACHAVGLHPSLGLLHADHQGRYSLALDLLEAIRPAIDRVILGILDCGLGVPYDSAGKPCYLDRKLFHETRDGAVRLVPPLTHKIASHAAQWAAAIRPHAENTARVLALATPGEIRVPRAKPASKPRVPASSYKRARLREGTTPADLLPDDVWRQVSVLIPPPARSPMPRVNTGKPVDTSKDRDAIAALAAHVLLGVPWGSVPVQGVSSRACEARMKAWTMLTAPGENRPAWSAMAEVLQASGHLSGLLA